MEMGKSNARCKMLRYARARQSSWTLRARRVRHWRAKNMLCSRVGWCECVLVCLPVLPCEHGRAARSSVIVRGSIVPGCPHIGLRQRFTSGTKGPMAADAGCRWDRKV